MLLDHQEYDVRTPFGPVHVAVCGERHLPAIFTYHDIGLNSELRYVSFMFTRLRILFTVQWRTLLTYMWLCVLLCNDGSQTHRGWALAFVLGLFGSSIPLVRRGANSFVASCDLDVFVQRHEVPSSTKITFFHYVLAICEKMVGDIE